MKKFVLIISTLLFLVIFSDCTRKKSGIQLNEMANMDAGTQQIIGSIDATTNISSNGEFVYKIPLDLPPGINNMEPSLTLIYGSQAPNGNIGMGWTIQGLDQIGRMGAIQAIDGFSGTVGYNSDDRFGLNGARLINISGNYGADKSVYHTEVETWKQITAHGSAGSGPDHFTMVDKQGIQYELGNTSDSKILADGQSSVRVWAINKKTDLSGNIMEISYTNSPKDVNTQKAISSPGGYYPETISYTSNSGTTANRSIKFYYESRTDAPVQYQGGSTIQTAARLVKIQAFLDTDCVREYDIDYEYGGLTGRSRVKSITEKGATQTLSPTQFASQDAATSFSTKATALSGAFTIGQGWNASDTYPITMGDVNGDGKMDIVGFKSGVQVSLAESQPATGGPYFGSPSSWNTGFYSGNGSYTSESQTPRYLADANGDGLADVIGFGLSGVSVALSSGSSFSTSGWNGGQVMADFGVNQGWNQNGLYPIQIADVNGDHKVDIVGFFRSDVMVSLSEGNKFGTATSWISDFTVGQGWQAPNLRIMADVNGDGRSDIVGFNYSGVTVALATENGFSKSGFNGGNVFPQFSRAQGWSTPDVNPIQMADVNGDGLMDIIGFNTQTMVSLSTGNGFTSPQKWSTDFSGSPVWTSNTPIQSIDINHDGMSDLVGFGTNGVLVGISDGGSFKTSKWNGGNAYPNFGVSQGWSTSQNLRLVADVDGNGMSDLVGFGNTNVEVGMNAGPIPDLLTTVTEGLGGIHAVTYSTISNPDVYSNTGSGNGNLAGASLLNFPLQLNATYPVSKPIQILGGRSTVVQSLTEKNDPSINSQTYNYSYSYTYENAEFDPNGRGWLGYGTITKADPQLGVNTSVDYLQQFPYTGLELQVTNTCATGSSDSKCSPGSVLSQQRMTYICQPGATCNAGDTKLTQPYPGVYQILAQNHFTDKYDYNTYKFSLLESKSYDNFGNVINQANYGRTDKSGTDKDPSDNLFVLSAFKNNTTANILGYITAKKQSNSSDTTGMGSCNCKTTNLFHSADLSLEAQEYNADMTVKKGCTWDDGSNIWEISTYQYDQFGNDTLKITPDNQKISKIIESTYHTYADYVLSPPDANGKRLKTSYGFDPSNGKQIARTDPNGNSTLMVLDNFGNQTGLQGPVPAGVSANGSTNLCDAKVTGSGKFTTATVITLSTQQNQSASGAIYTEAMTLQSWNNVFKTTKNYLDGRNRKYKEEDDCTGQSTIVSTMTFNSADLEIEKVLPHFSGSGASKATLTTTYDAYKRPLTRVSVVGGNGGRTSTTTFAYSMDTKSVIVTETEGSGSSAPYVRESHFEFFNSQSVATSIKVVSDNNATSTFTYDPLARVISAVSPPAQNNPGGMVDSTYYDSQSRKIKTVNSALGTETYVFGANGKMHTIANANGTQTLSYDNLARVTKREFPDGRVVHLHYDSTGVKNGLGRVTWAQSVDSGGQAVYSSSWAYDAYGNQAQENISVYQINGKTETYTSNQTFDPQNRLLTGQFPGNIELNYAYTGCNLTSISNGTTPLAMFSNYSAFDKPQKIEYGNNAVSKIAYSADNKMISNKVNAAGGSDILHDSISWNTLNQITQIKDLNNSGTDYTQNFTYTAKRLTQATATGTYGTLSFAYDQAGNMTQKGNVNYTYAGYQVSSGESAGSQIFQAQYGQMGQMKSRTLQGSTQKIKYDSENRITSVTSGSDTETYAYDYKGRRLRKTDKDGNITLYFSGYYEKVIYANKKTAATAYAKTPGGDAATVTVSSDNISKAGFPDVGTLYIHGNNIQSTVATTDESGALASLIIYQPYGQILTLTGENNFRPKFTGKEQDLGTTFYYFGGRYFDAFTGRFLSADTDLAGSIARQDALNRYAYGFNNPTIYLDPDGHSPWWEDALMIAADVALVVVGVVLIVATDGAAAPIVGIIGAGLIGAGISGGLYNLEHLGHQSLSGWGIQLGVGLASGLVTGGIGALGSSITASIATSMVEEGAEDLSLTLAQKAVIWTGRGITGAVAGAGASVTGQVVGNLLNNQKPFYHFNGWAVLEGAGAGLIGGLVAGGSISKLGNIAASEAEEEGEVAAEQITYKLISPKWTRLIMPVTFQTNKVVLNLTQPQW